MNIKNMLVDVILPTYNQCELLPRALQAIVNQTSKYFTFIVVNDGSTDDTHNVIEQFRNKFVNFQYIINEKNIGLPASLNIGHKAGTSRFCTWISSDNVSHSDHVERLYEFITANDLEFVQSAWYKIKGEKKSTIDMRIKKGPLGIGNIGASFLYTRNLWEKYRYDETLQGAEDLKFFAQIKLGGHRMGYLDIPLVTYYRQSNSLSDRLGRKKLDSLAQKLKLELNI